MIEVIGLAMLAVIGAVTAWVEFHAVVSEMTIVNPEGEGGTALIVYQKGLGTFQPRVASAFAEGLVSRGWRVESTTVNSYAPTDLSSYDLLDIGWPTYWFSPSLLLRRYVKRIGALDGKRVVVICTAAGAPAGSCEKMRRIVQAAHGTVVRSLTLFTMRPNEGNDDPEEIATNVGREIALPSDQEGSC
jgi:flavorubredoxin